MNYFKYLFGEDKQEKTVMDKAPSRDAYIIFCNDIDGTIPRIVNAIGKHGNGGHTFDIVLEPDTEDKETFCWDGDGSDRIDSIIRLNGKEADKNGKDALINMLLNTLNSIYFQARDGSESDERRAEFQEPPLTTEEMRNIFENIIHDAKVCLEGCEFKDVKGRSLDNIKEYCESELAIINGEHPGNAEITVKEVLEHIKGIAEEALNPKKK